MAISGDRVDIVYLLCGLSAVELLLFREILEVLVIREDLDGVRGAEEEVSPFLKCLDDRE